MSLVLYPDSEDEDHGGTEALAAQASPPSTNTTTAGAKRKRSTSEQKVDSELPPLPAAFHDLYSANARISTSDDPSLHGGRKRTVPHVEGNWPSHLYLEWVPSQSESEKLLQLIDHVGESIEHANKVRRKPLLLPNITPSLRSDLGASLPLHISLSRTLQIKTEDREHFLHVLNASLRKAAVKSFNIRFSSLKWVPNFERNRWFLVLGIEKPAQDELNRLLNACNETAERCGYPALYTGGRGDGPMDHSNFIGDARKKRPTAQNEVASDETRPEGVDHTDKFHVSIAWNLIEPDPEWTSLVRGIKVDTYIHSIEAPFYTVKAKIGNVINSVDLSIRNPSLGQRGGLLGLS